MSDWTFAIQVSALALSVLWLALGLHAGQRATRPALKWVWLLFCASTALLSVKRLAAVELGAAQYLVGLGACFTCNAFWLVARGLFRAEPGAIGRLPLLFALTIAGLLMTRQLLDFTTAMGGWSAGTGIRLGQALGELTGMLGSTVLVLAFWEGVRGWATATAIERRVRSVYLLTYGGCVLGSSSIARLAGTEQLAQVEALLEATALLVILLVAQALVWWRLRQPLATATVTTECPAPNLPSPTAVPSVPPPQQQRDPEPAAPDVQEIALANRLEALLRERHLFLEPELKLMHLAQELDVSEYRVSRAITGTLGERNVNRWLNRRRIEHASALLRHPERARQSILDIALASGFASLGPFNRAFKELTGMTPGAWRNGTPDC